MNPVSQAEPPRQVARAFGASGGARRLAGGSAASWLVGDLVLKPIDDPEETAWVQSLADRIEADGFGVAQPVRTETGKWVVDGWCASRFVSDLEPVAPDWARICAIGDAFSQAATRALDGSEHVLHGRTHRWAEADRVAWGEHEVTLTVAATDVLEDLRGLLGVAPSEQALIHGDLAGNVFVAAGDAPVVLDISPYLRPARWASAIVVADAVLWNEAPLEIATEFMGSDADRDLLGRALVYRLVAEQLADDPRHGALLDPYRRVVRALTE